MAFLGGQLALLSFSSGCMDILSYRELGQVFTSAMTGNAALLGLDLGQGNLAAASRSLAAFASFLLGLVGGAAMLRWEREAGWSAAVTRTLGLEFVLLLGFSALWALTAGPVTLEVRYGLIVLSAVAMGIQSAAAHTIGVPGITTTYFTGTITNIVVGAVGRTLPREHRAHKPIRWPVGAFVAYVLGAASTGFLTAHSSVLPPVTLTALPALTIGIVLATAMADSRRG